MFFIEWYHPITIEIYKSQSGNFSPSDENSQIIMTIHGRLQHGQLHGMVLMFGILSNDPKSLCSRTVFNGLEFVGHFSHGKARGICWKRLIGGSWIYGEVDSEGEFTGKAIPLVNFTNIL